MAGWVCADCTTVYTVGAPRCPQCQSTDHAELGEEAMPKITVQGGPTIAVGGVTVSGSWGDEPPETAGAVEPPASTAPAPDDEGGAPSPGKSSPASSEKEPTSSEPNETASPSPARKMASRSKKVPTDSSSARGTDGGPTAATSDKS